MYSIRDVVLLQLMELEILREERFDRFGIVGKRSNSVATHDCPVERSNGTTQQYCGG